MSSSSTLAADWPAPAGVHALATTRRGSGASLGPFADFNLGDACGDDPEAVAANRAQLAQALRLPSAPCWMRQVHGARVVSFDRSDLWLPEADAAVTSTSGVVLAVLSADCLPVVFCSSDGSEIGVAHAGWRGLAAGVIEATVAAMRTPPKNLMAWLGPAIGPARYEVGEEVRAALAGSRAGALSAFAPTRPGHWQCDLYAIARDRLAGAGVDSIHGGALCTHADPGRFFSHRRDGICGRMATLVWMTPAHERQCNRVSTDT